MRRPGPEDAGFRRSITSSDTLQVEERRSQMSLHFKVLVSYVLLSATIVGVLYVGQA